MDIKIKICDICGKQITKGYGRTVNLIYKPHRVDVENEYELCPECYQRVKEFIENEKKEYGMRQNAFDASEGHFEKFGENTFRWVKNGIDFIRTEGKP